MPVRFRSASAAVILGLSAAVGAATTLVARPGQQLPQAEQQAGQAQAGRQGGRGRGGTQIQPGQECPPGMTEVRAGSCQTPALPVPTIVDYRPKTTLVTKETPVPRAKFPVIDYHAHLASRGFFDSQETLSQLVQMMDSLNLRVMVATDSLSGERLQRVVALLNASPHKDRFRVMTRIDFSDVGPGWAEKAVAQLEADVKAGAVGVGEIGKDFGLRTRKPDGSLLRLDDPALDPIWQACARLRIPVLIHTGEPQAFFDPLDNHNERLLELSLFANRRVSGDEFPSFNELMAQRDRLFKRHPKTTFVAAHLGWHGNDLGRIARMFDEMPNVYGELGAVLYELGRQPRGGRDFLLKYADRVMFGKDTVEASEYPYYWRVFETADDYFDYYRDYHAFWKMYGLDLPDNVLQQIYFKTALAVTPGLPQSGWPR
jgi:predicted TIM-barrel fold metal-dependent hydrolase